LRGINQADTTRCAGSDGNCFQKTILSTRTSFGRDSVTIPFSSSIVAAVADSLWGLLETIESRLDGVYQLQSEIFSSQFLLLNICELLGERIVAQHLDPVLKVPASEMEL